MELLPPADMVYIASLTGIWKERFQRLFKIHTDQRRPLDTTLRMAYSDVKRWKETGEL